jgi:hypothetical protein
MNEIDVLADLYEDIVRDLGRRSSAHCRELAWQPGPRQPDWSDGLAYCPGMDFLVTRIIYEAGGG